MNKNNFLALCIAVAALTAVTAAAAQGPARSRDCVTKGAGAAGHTFVSALKTI